MTTARLGDIADIRTGFAFRGAIEPSSAGTHLVLQAKDVGEVFVNLSNLPLVDLGERGKLHELASGDVIMVARGRNVAAQLPDMKGSKPTVAAGSVYVLRPNPSAVDPTYLAWAINRPETQLQLRAMAQGSHIPFVSKQALAALEIPVPPIEVQRAVGRAYALVLKERELTDKLARLRVRLTHALCSAAVREREEEP